METSWMENIFNEIVEKTMAYLNNANIYNMVLGISGGIDSTVTAAIAARICQLDPKFNLFGMVLDTSTNEDDEVDTAMLVADNFTTAYISENIEKDCARLIGVFSSDAKLLGYDITPTAKGNIKARYRMMRLFNLAGCSNGIVLDTDNLSEHYLGFFTVNGDVGDLNPIGDLWKSNVYKLAEYLAHPLVDIFDDKQKDAIQRSINLVPTDGNGVKAGGDMAQIAPGYTYYDVDPIIYAIVHNTTPATKSEILNELTQMFTNMPVDILDGILTRIINSDFKRKQKPIKIELSTSLLPEPNS